MSNTIVVWFRRDLRLTDHQALNAAMNDTDTIVPVVIIDPDFIRAEGFGAPLVRFFFDSVRELESSLNALGSRLVIRLGAFETEIADVVRQAGATALYFNHDYEPATRARDGRVQKLLENMGCVVRSFKDQVVFEENELLTGSGTPYRVFTPFSKAWKARSAEIPQPYPFPKQIPAPPQIESIRCDRLPSLGDLGLENEKHVLVAEPGEKAGLKTLARFVSAAVDDYDTQRNIPSTDGTSRLSAALRSGTISVRSAYFAARKVGGTGADSWINELIWRDFYQYILFHYPHVIERDFLETYRDVVWNEPGAEFRLWSAGQTGYPIVDAGMRQLVTSGWMHNRLRMITASFLTKHLLIHWRHGERFFARHLVDFDLASNNGGWQWSASTGTDAQPYFRIFNPITQGKRFDANGAFVRMMCPELAKVPVKYLFSPWEMPVSVQMASGCRIGVDYPGPIVDHKTARARVLEAFQRVR